MTMGEGYLLRLPVENKNAVGGCAFYPWLQDEDIAVMREHVVFVDAEFSLAELTLRICVLSLHRSLPLGSDAHRASPSFKLDRLFDSGQKRRMEDGQRAFGRR